MIIQEVAFKLFPRLINDPYNPMEDDNQEYRDIWIEGAKWQQEQQDQFAIKFGVWLSVNCDQDTSKDGSKLLCELGFNMSNPEYILSKCTIQNIENVYKLLSHFDKSNKWRFDRPNNILMNKMINTRSK